MVMATPRHVIDTLTRMGIDAIVREKFLCLEILVSDPNIKINMEDLQCFVPLPIKVKIKKRPFWMKPFIGVIFYRRITWV